MRRLADSEREATSAGGRFQLAAFLAANSTSRYYDGLWYGLLLYASEDKRLSAAERDRCGRIPTQPSL